MHPARARLTILAVTLLLLAACASSTKLVRHWQDADFHPPAYHRAIILAMTPDEVDRRAYETAFVQRLAREKSIQGVAGYTLMPEYVAYKDEQKVLAAVRQAKADLVLIASLISIKKNERYVPPRTDYHPTFGVGFGYHSYSHMSFGMTYRPGYVKKEVRVRLEVTAFDARMNKMIWAGTTECFNPESSQKLIAEHLDVVVKALKKGGILE